MDQKTIAINMMVTGPFPAQMAASGASVQTFGNQAHAGMAKAGTAMQRFGQRATKIATIGTLAIAAGLALSAKAAIDFESSFTGIRKTVDTSEEGFRMLAMGIREMATEIPIGVNELNRIGELGGQLGVDPGDLLGFIDVIAKIGVTTTLSTEAAAMGFARIDNVMQLGGKSFDNVGAAIVDLGNNFAATEDEILTFATRIAPIGATVGLVTDEVLAIATAFTSVGVPAERGGTAIQKTFIKMSEAVMNGGIELDTFSRTAGMAADEFADLFEADPAEAFTAFVEGLGDVREEGGNVFAILDTVGLSNQRVISSLLAAANATGVLREALDLSATAWGDNTALAEEAQKRFETTEAALVLLKNKVQEIAIGLGSQLLPAINTMITGGESIIDFFVNMDGAMQAVVIGIPAFLAALTAAAAHPVIAAIVAAGGALYAIGEQAKNSAAGTDVMRGAVEALNAELDSEELSNYLGAQGIDAKRIEEDLAKAGLSMEDFKEAVMGTDEEFREFQQEYLGKQPIFSWNWNFLAESTNDVLTRVRKAWQDAGKWQVQDRLQQVAEMDAIDKENIEMMKARGQERADILSGRIDPEPVRPAIIDDKYMKDIDQLFQDYTDVFAEAFDETDERIRGQINLWYEFGDALKINFGELIPNLLRQVQAIEGFENVLEELGLDTATEAFIRQSFNTPALMEAFREFKNTSVGEFHSFIQELEAITGPDGILMGVIFDAFTRELPDLEFVAGAQMLSSMSAIVDEIMNDPDNNYNAGEVWLGVIQAALIRGGSELAPTLIDTLTTIFGAGGIPGVDLTIADIEELARVLGLLPEKETVEVEYRLTYTVEGERVPEPTMGYIPGVADYPTGVERGKAYGGSVFAGEPYIVGEKGSELFVPFANGTIIPNDKLGGSVTNNTTVEVIRPTTNDLPGDISEGLTRASITEQVDLIGVH